MSARTSRTLLVRYVGWALALLAFFAVLVPGQLAHADVEWPPSGNKLNAEVTDWSIVKPDGSEASVDNPLQQSAGENTLKVSWKLPQGTTVSKGDWFQINALDVPDGHYKPFRFESMNEWIPLEVGGKVVGHWRATATKFSPIAIQVVFDGDLEGSDFGFSGNFDVANIGVQTQSNTGQNGDWTDMVTVGGITQEFGFKKQAPIPLKSDALEKQAGTVSSDAVVWIGYFGRSVSANLAASQGKTVGEPLPNYIVEDPLIEGAEFENLVIFAPLFRIEKDDQGVQQAYVPAVYEKVVTDRFTRVDQSAGQTYAEFKGSLTPRQWGVYKDADGSQTFVLNMGDLGVKDGGGLTFQDVLGAGTEPGTFAKGQGLVSDAVAQAMNEAFGSTNSIGGQIPTYYINLKTSYGVQAVSTIKNNTMTMGATSSTASAKIDVDGGNVTARSGEAILVKFDEDTGRVIPGAEFKLQKQAADGTWADCQPVSGEVVRATGENGQVSFEGLGLGTYRFVEVAAAPYYDIATVVYDPSDTFTVTENDAGHVVRASNALQNPYKEIASGSGADSSSATVGDEITYTIGYRNDSGAVVEAAMFDDLDANVEFVSASDGGVYDKTTHRVTWSQASLQPQVEMIRTVTVKVLDSAVGIGKVYNTGGVIVSGKEIPTNKVETPVVPEPLQPQPGVLSGAASLSGMKALSGSELAEGQFSFQLKALTDGAPMPKGSSNGVCTTANGANGAYAFGDITYTTPGVYEYAVSEVNDGQENVIYDDHVAKVTVTVSEPASPGGAYQVEVKTEGSLDFSNTFEAVVVPDPDPEPAPKPEPAPEPKPLDQDASPSSDASKSRTATPRTGDDNLPLVAGALATAGVAAVSGAYALRRARKRF